MSTEKFDPETFTLYTGSKPRTQEIDRLSLFVDSLPLDSVYRVTVKKGEEGRREVANRLYQICIGQIVEQLGKDESAVAGWSKYHILLPMKFVYAAEKHDDEMRERAEWERELCNLILASDYTGEKLYQAFDRQIRSKAPYTTVGLFARYFERFIIRWSGEGAMLRLKPSEKARVLGDQCGSQAA